MAQGAFKSKVINAKNIMKSGSKKQKRQLAADAGMFAVNTGIQSSGLGFTLNAVTGKDFDDLVGYEYNTDLGKTMDTWGDTQAQVNHMIAPVAVGIGAGIATGSPQVGMAAMQGTQAVQGLYGAVDGRETEGAIDPDMAAGYSSILNSAGGAYMGMGMPGAMRYGGRRKKMYAMGGEMLTEFDGPSHENGGVAVGANEEVEGGETQFNAQDYVFSDRLKLTKSMLRKLEFPDSWKGKTFAEVSKAIQKKYDPIGKREDDMQVKNATERELKRLIAAQEMVRTQKFGDMEPEVFMMGGRRKYANGGPAIDTTGPMGVYGSNGNYIPYYTDEQLAAMDTPMTLSPMQMALYSGQPLNIRTTVPGQDPGIDIGTPNAGNEVQLARGATSPTPGVDPYSWNPDFSGSAGGAAGKSGISPNTLSQIGTAAADITTVAASMANIRDLKKNKPKPKDIHMFDVDADFESDPINREAIMTEISDAEARGERAIYDLAGRNAYTALANRGQLSRDTQKARARARLDIEIADNELQFRDKSANRNIELQNMRNAMVVQDWNDADIQTWMGLLMDERSNMANNVSTSSTNRRRERQAREYEYGSTG